jgi:5-hydroxyisourate hydrolase-like protein (transthyretin family)
MVLLLLSCSLGWAQTYTIAGVVRNDGGRPVKRVRVAVASVEARENQTAMQTGEDGRFRFEGLAAGKYQLTAEPPTGGRQAYGTRSLSTEFGTVVATGPEFHSDNLVFQLIPAGAIGGRVLDAEGDPAEGVLVQLFAARMLRGKRSVVFGDYAYTDDRGEYRFGGVADGTYYLAAAGKPWYVDRLVRATGSLAQMGCHHVLSECARGATGAGTAPEAGAGGGCGFHAGCGAGREVNCRYEWGAPGHASGAGRDLRGRGGQQVLGENRVVGHVASGRDTGDSPGHVHRSRTGAGGSGSDVR